MIRTVDRDGGRLKTVDFYSRAQLLIAQGRVPPMILVFPDGRIDGRIDSDSEWANTPSGRFESYIVDVVHDVDHRSRRSPIAKTG
jgi:hypothetical protein